MSKNNQHFIKNIEIKNFKCFKDFKADGLARVNLITGKNNVGKTAFMEACLTNAHSVTLSNLVASLDGIKFARENINVLFSLWNSTLTSHSKNNAIKYLEKANNMVVNSNINNISFFIKERDGIKIYKFNFANEEIIVNSKDFSIKSKWLEEVQFIDNFGLSNTHIINNFSSMQKLDKENYLNTALNNFDNSIESFKIIDEKPQCKINGEYREITELGDGTRHLVSIIISLFKCSDGYLFIDEMDSGIHYSKLDELWGIILKTSKELNIQVFATTHSKECIESYARVSQKLANKEVSLIELGKKDNKIESIVFNYQGIKHHIEQKLEVRGW